MKKNYYHQKNTDESRNRENASFHDKNRERGSSRSQGRSQNRDQDRGHDRAKGKEHSSFQDDASFCVGTKPLRELLENTPQRVEWVRIRKGQKNADTQRILDLCSLHNIRFTLVDDSNFKKISTEQNINSQGVIAKLKEVSTVTFEDMLINASSVPLPLIIALDCVQDPGNVGTLARTLYALGGAGMVMPTHNSASLGIGAKKSAAGALDYLPISKVTNLSQALESASEAGYTIYSTALFKNDTVDSEKLQRTQKKAQNIPILNPFETKLAFPAVLVLGGEEKGVRPLVHSKCDASLLIPMQREFDSLNVAQAGAILTSCFLKNKLSEK